MATSAGRDRTPIIGQHVLGGDSGPTRRPSLQLDHVAEVHNALDALHALTALVNVTVADDTLECADRA